MSTDALMADTTPLLPVEILLAIFAHLPLASRITATHVCRHWRDVALAAPALLWSQIVSSGSRPGALEAQLARAVKSKTDLMLLVPKRGYKKMIAAAAEHLHKVRSLSYSVPVEDCVAAGSVAEWHDSVVGLLSCPAPALEVLYVSLLDDDKLPTPLFSGQCAKLQRVSLRSMKPTTPYFLHPSVTVLEYSCFDLDCGTLLAFGSMFSSITALKLDCGFLQDLPATDRSMLSPFPCLIYLSVRVFGIGIGDCVQSIELLFDLLRHQDLKTIDIDIPLRCGRDDHMMLLVETLVDTLHTSQQLAFTAVEDFCIVAARLTDARGFSRMLRADPCYSLLTAPVLSRITTLKLTEIEVVTDLAGVCLPFVHTLMVYILAPRAHISDEVAALSMFLLAPHQPQVIDCPMLRRLRLSALVPKDICPSYGDIPTLSPEMICDFVQQSLRTSPLRLDVLSFHAVAILQHVPKDVSAMLLLAHDVQFDRAPLEPLNVMDCPFDLDLRWD